MLEAFGPQNCIGTYCGTPVAGMVPFDLAKAAMARVARKMPVRCRFIGKRLSV